MSELDANLIQLRTSFDEIEKRIKAIERQVTSSTQLAATKACLQEIKTLLEDYQSAYSIHLQNYTNHTTEFNSHKQESDQNIADLQSASSIYGASINTLTTKSNTIQSSLERLSARVLALEQNSGGDDGSSSAGNSSGATNWNDIAYFNYFQEINSSYSSLSNFYFPKLIFDCSPGYAEVEMTFELESTDPIYNFSFILDINKKTYPQQAIETFSGKKTFTFKKQFLTSKSLNELTICFRSAMTQIILKNFYVKIHAKNVKIFKRFQPVEIFCFNDNYYITDMSDPNSLYYGIISKDNFTYKKSDLNPLPYNFLENRQWATKLMPAILYGDTIQTRSDNDGIYFLTYKLGTSSYYFTSYQKLTDATAYSEYSSSFENSYCDDFYPFGFNTNGVGVHHYYVTADKVRTMSTKNAYGYLTLNGVKLTAYNYIYIVRNNNLKIGDPLPQHRGAILCRASDNMFVYFPEIDSTYCVELQTEKMQLHIINQMAQFLFTSIKDTKYININYKKIMKINMNVSEQLIVMTILSNTKNYMMDMHLYRLLTHGKLLLYKKKGHNCGLFL